MKPQHTDFDTPPPGAHAFSKSSGWINAKGEPLDIDGKVTTQEATVFAPHEAVIAAQAEGEELFEPLPTSDGIPEHIAVRFREIYDQVRHEAEQAVREEGDVTLGFYVDGYSVHSTATIGEVRVVRYDGKEKTFKSKTLTDFFDRRIDPPNVTPE